MFKGKTLNFQILSILLSVSIITILVFKFYFIPKVDRFLELSVEQNMKSNMIAFEKVIQKIALAANGDDEVVRRALNAIHNDREIAVRLRRSRSIQIQYGNHSSKEAQNELESKVFITGTPVFVSTNKKFQYIYPLKVVKICQDCHHSEQQENIEIPLGYVLGLAISEIPKSFLLENKLWFFVKDLFVINIVIVLSILLLIYLFIQWVLILPVKRLEERASHILSEKSGDDGVPISPVQNEIRSVNFCLEEIKKFIK